MQQPLTVDPKDRIERIERRLTTPRAAGVAGVLFALLFGGSLIMLRLALPEALLCQVAWTERQATSISLVATMAPFAGITFLWFLGVIRNRLGELEDRFFGTIFFGSGLLFVAMLFVASALAASTISALQSTGGYSQDRRRQLHCKEIGEALNKTDRAIRSGPAGGPGLPQRDGYLRLACGKCAACAS